MELFEAFAARHCYRDAFTSAPVSRADLHKIVAAGLTAPSGCNRQTTRFVVVDDPETLAKIVAVMPQAACTVTAQAMIVSFVDVRAEAVFEGYSFEAEDCATAQMAMLLAIADLGYASVWLDGVLRVDNRAHKIGAILGVPSDKIARVLLPIGVPAQPVAPREKMPFDERAWFNGWQKID